MLYVVGLGNPGPKYEYTRHNIGWLALDTFCDQHDFGQIEHEKRHNANIRSGVLGEVVTRCVYPQTYMNRSGEAVQSLLKEDAEAVLVVVHDDIALPLGTVRISYGRGHGGHNGVKSIFSHYKSNDFCRIRIGVAPDHSGWLSKIVPKKRTERIVLEKFSVFERQAVQQAREKASEALLSIVTKGCDAAMNMHN